MSKLREPVNSITHFIGAGAALIGLIVLMTLVKNDSARMAAVIAYGISLILLFLASAVYHMIIASPRIIEVFRKIDHSAIYLLIAGTYTPICIFAFHGFFKWGFLAIIWSIALAGIMLAVFFINIPRWLTTGIYVLMGWLSLSAMGQITNALPTATIAWMIAGGVIYTLGAVVYATKKLNLFPGKFGYHELWHIFVLLGAAAHFVTIFRIVTNA